MQIFTGRSGKQSSQGPAETFTGEVWRDPVMPSTGAATINDVFFKPAARTHWHTHEQGQILQVKAGLGWICTDGEQPQAIRPGDVVWIPAGERHWHGATADSYMLHTAISLGKTNWEDAVIDEQYPEQGA